jgi:hypothetical protein
LSESKKLLEEARQELRDAQEKSQSTFTLSLPPQSFQLTLRLTAVPASHTFSPLPGFFDRPNEIKAIQRALGSVPTFTVLFGASSVGKTALLRQVLSSDKYQCVFCFLLRVSPLKEQLALALLVKVHHGLSSDAFIS